MATQPRTEKKAGGGPFTFIKSRKELKRQHSNDDGSSAPGSLGRWLRELRPAASRTPAPAPSQLDRTHPVYHSEGKGLRRRKDRDKRRHSFNEQQPPLKVPPAKHAGDGRSDSACARQMAREVAPPPEVMMAAHSTNNNNNHLVQPPVQGHHQVQASLTGSKGASIYSYLHTQSGLNFAPVVHLQHWEQQQQQQQQQQWLRQDAGSPPSTPPVRDACSLKSVKYGPGHEKFPSWPMSAAAEPIPPPRTAPGGGSHRSKSWTDHTNYPKEQGIPYTRPYMKRPSPAYTQQQLKTVMERCEKIPPETYESRSEEGQSRMYLPRVDREGKLLGDSDYVVPSPPERDGAVTSKPHLTQADLEEYARSYRDPPERDAVLTSKPHLTQADLEEYARSYEDALRPQHQQQPSYAQSEGYHSYVSSSDSTMATPFLDRLRRDSEAMSTLRVEEDRPGRDSVVTTSSGSASSSETLKWHGSTSDVSVTSHRPGDRARQLIAHSAKVQTPQRHNSESVLYPPAWRHHNKLRLFPVNTYAVEPEPALPRPTVAERVGELERRQTRYTYLDPDKRHRVSDPTLKAIQKKALLSFYERHHSSSGQAWRSEPQLAQTPMTLAPCPPQPPPRPRANQASRRASSASDYAGGAWRDKVINRTEAATLKDTPRHQHSNSCGSLSSDLLGPLIVGPSISLDDWVPERPPKKPHLRSAFPPPLPDRTVSPDLPPPSPPTVLEDEVFASDEPLPPPPPEVNSDWSQPNVEKQQERLPSILKHGVVSLDSCSPSQRLADNGVHPSSDEPTPPSAVPPRRPTQSPTNRTFARTLSMKKLDSVPHSNTKCGVPPMNLVDKNRSALKYQTQKLMVNGKIATSFPVRENAERIEHRHGSILQPSIAPCSILQPSIARLQRIPAPSRSPPHSTTNLDQSHESEKVSQTSPSVDEKPPDERLPSPPLSPESDDINDCDLPAASQLGSNDQLSTSKASYLAHRRDRDGDVADLEGSYKRTTSPCGDHKQTDCDRLPDENAHTATVAPSQQAMIIVPSVDPAVVVGTGTDPVECECPDSDDVELTGMEVQTQCDIASESVPSPPTSPLVVQRPQVVLQVNASSQTVDIPPPTQVRHKLQEEIECERLSLDLASQLSPSDKLQGILVPVPEHKKPLDYVAGLFRLDIVSRPREVDPQPSESERQSSREPLGGGSELHHKKEDLMCRLTRKLDVLRAEQIVVTEESRVNRELGETVSTQVSRLARPHEAAKYRLHVEEVGKITSLLLGLSGRLARVDNALAGMGELHLDRTTLESKRDKLQEQLEEAKKLKENIDRRSVIVSNILYKYFNSEEYADYDHFINMKAKLIMESREIIDKIKLGEEQLVALRETLSYPES